MGLGEHEIWAYEKLITAEQSETGCANEFWAVEIGTYSGCVNRLPLFPDIMIRELLHLILWVVVF